jgi:hypothetical protein
MSAPKSPPPGSMPSSLGSPDVQSMMNQAMAAKNAGGGATTGSPALTPPGAMNPATTSTRSPRPVGTPLQELKYIGKDVGQGVLGIIQSLFPPLRILPSDTPETQAKKNQMAQKMQQWDQDRIQFAHQRYQEEMTKKQQEEQVEQQKAAQKAAQSKDLPTPSGKRSGAAAPGQGQSKKQSFMDDFDKKRQQLSSAS